MNINECTLGELKEIAALFGNSAAKKIPYKIGKKYLVRCVTYHTVGKLKEISGDFLIFEDASWVADSGRFGEALKTGVFSETEKYVNDVQVNMGAIADSTEWAHELPKESK